VLPHCVIGSYTCFASVTSALHAQYYLWYEMKLVTDGVILYDDDSDTSTVSNISSLHIRLKKNSVFAFYIMYFNFKVYFYIIL
jgi:hypothetical protein